MPRTAIWLATLVSVGWFCSQASAFHIIANLRSRNATVSTDVPAPPGTTISNGEIINGQTANGLANGPVDETAAHGGLGCHWLGCHCLGGHCGICGGHLLGAGGRIEAAKAHVNAWLLDVPQKQPPLPPPPVPIHPYVRSPRDYFMVGDP